MPAANDDFSNAQTITGASGTVAFDLTGATAESGEPTPALGTTVWFAWTAPSSAPIQFDTTASVGDPDTYLSVYTGTAVNALTLIADDDDSGNDPAVGHPSYGASLLTFTPTSGTTYYIQIDAYDPSVSGILTWQPGPLPPPPAPFAGSWTQAPGRGLHTAFAGDDISVTGGNLDTLDTVTIGGFPQSFTVIDAGNLTVHVDSTARSGPITVANVSGSDDATGYATVLFAGPWIQPPDRVTSDPNFADAAYHYNYDGFSTDFVSPTQPDNEGSSANAGSSTQIQVAQWVLSDPDDPSWKWILSGALLLAQANLPQYSMPPIDYTPIFAADPTIYDIETETPGGTAVSDIAVSGVAEIKGEWADAADHKTSGDLTGDLWQTAVQFRRLDSSDWTSTDPGDIELAAGSWPSKTWLASLPLELSVDSTPAGTVLTITTEDDSGIGSRVDNTATHEPETYTEPTAVITWAEYESGVAWIAVLDRLVDQPAISLPLLASDSTVANQRKSITATTSLLMTWAYRPPRYRLLREEPSLTLPPLRQVGRADRSRQHPRAHVDGSRQTGRIP